MSKRLANLRVELAEHVSFRTIVAYFLCQHEKSANGETAQLTSIPGRFRLTWIGDREYCSSSTFNCGASNLGACLPDDLSGMQEFWTTGRWIILPPRDVRELTIVPFVGDCIGNKGGEIQTIEAAGGCTICRKVLAISTSIHGPMVMSEHSRWKVKHGLHVVSENT
jgi:hypothetical protein